MSTPFDVDAEANTSPGSQEPALTIPGVSESLESILKVRAAHHVPLLVLVYLSYAQLLAAAGLLARPITPLLFHCTPTAPTIWPLELQQQRRNSYIS